MTQYLHNLKAEASPEDPEEVIVKPNLWLLSEDEIPPLLFTVEDAARTLHVGKDKVYDLTRVGELRSFKLGGLRRISARALAEFIARVDVAT